MPEAKLIVPDVPLDLGSYASVSAFGAHMRSVSPRKRMPHRPAPVSLLPSFHRASYDDGPCHARQSSAVDRIDVLCCNAGRGGPSGAPIEPRTADGREPIMQVGCVSHRTHPHVFNE